MHARGVRLPRGAAVGSAGGLIALAAAVKAFPFLAIGYLVYRRFWRATAALLVALTLPFVVLPMPFRGVAGAYDDAGTWTMGMVLRYDSGSIAQRPERGFGHKNQSLMALANRLLRDIPADGEARDGWKVNVASLSFGTVNKIILASALILGSLYVGLMPWRAPRTRPTAAIEGALLLLLILVFSPLSFNYFYVWLLYPLTVALYLGGEAPPGRPSGGSCSARWSGRWACLGSRWCRPGWRRATATRSSPPPPCSPRSPGSWRSTRPSTLPCAGCSLDDSARVVLRRCRAGRRRPGLARPASLTSARPPARNRSAVARRALRRQPGACQFDR